MIMTYTILKLQPDNKLKIKIKVFAPQRKIYTTTTWMSKKLVTPLEPANL
jgi:hypothetical protein